MSKVSTVEDYLAAVADPLREIGLKLRPIIETALPDAHAAVWHGHPVWSLTEAPGKGPVCLLKAYTQHVTFGLWRGQTISDPSGRLVPSGSAQMAHVKLRSVADIDSALFTDWLHQAWELEKGEQ